MLIPLHKKSDKSCTNKYCPVPVAQCGFTLQSSTVKAVQNVVSMAQSSSESISSADATQIDLRNAFDYVNHKIILEELWSYGIRDLELLLIKSYMSNRKQIVSYSGQNSQFLNVTRDVSLCGPLLFVTFINDLCSNMPCRSVLYADDTTFINSGKDTTKLKFQCKYFLQLFNMWFESNELAINNEKTVNILC
ncbi:uncharacterized protein LOC124798837 [Schistocerca piceifrons]|uniref:uncharacterized protein LOC124798837 n=1 Tax=Schistocerca piceifrons TaxID=274613 RepID=UPI001F5FDCBD|nr:uncharacterized protein LOC124798837 [Schistocerca piceifrons]